MTVLAISSQHSAVSRQTHKLRAGRSEVIVCLEQVLGGAPLDPAAFLESVRALRHSISHVYVTEEDLQTARNEGRP